LITATDVPVLMGCLDLSNYKDYPKCRGSVAADVTRWFAQLSAPDEMSTLRYP
jgi:hypothetical protein